MKKTSETHTTASGTITVNGADGFLELMRTVAKHAPIEERVDWDCDEDGYGKATLDGEKVAAIVPPYNDDVGPWPPYWFVQYRGVHAEGDCTDADDGYHKVVAMLRFLEGWKQDNG